jgi:hypothetical protein
MIQLRAQAPMARVVAVQSCLGIYLEQSRDVSQGNNILYS